MTPAEKQIWLLLEKERQRHQIWFGIFCVVLMVDFQLIRSELQKRIHPFRTIMMETAKQI